MVLGIGHKEGKKILQFAFWDCNILELKTILKYA